MSGYIRDGIVNICSHKYYLHAYCEAFYPQHTCDILYLHNILLEI